MTEPTTKIKCLFCPTPIEDGESYTLVKARTYQLEGEFMVSTEAEDHVEAHAECWRRARVKHLGNPMRETS